MTTTSTTEQDGARVQVGSPGGILAVIPHLLGYAPESSFVVIGCGSDAQVKVTMRYDLPDPADDQDAARIADHAVALLRSQNLTSAVAAGYGPDHLVRPAAQALLGKAADHNVDVRDVLRQDEGRYWSYTCTHITCCPPCGSPAAAADDQAVTTIAGKVPALASRAALAATLDPIGGITRESMREATRRAERHISQIITTHGQRGTRQARAKIIRESLATVAEMIGVYRGGGSFQADYQLAWLSVVLRDMRIRDDAWARMDPEHNAAHRRLWTDMTRRAQPGYIAAPASLLAFCAWQSGNGALANVALDRAQADDRAYSMAGLLRDVITAGVPPTAAVLPMTPEQVADEYDVYDNYASAHDDDREDDCLDQAGSQPGDHNQATG